MTVRLRFAPSPTGYLHIGGARTALYPWMFARRHGGQFILRIEDTDLKRTRPGAIEDIMASLRWLGLDWDEGPDIGGPHGPYIQTQRKALYGQWAHWLVEHGQAYKCFCTPEELEQARAEAGSTGYNRRCRNLTPAEVAEREAAGREYVIRFKMPLAGSTVVPDLVRGDITFDNSQVTDYVLLKSNGLPTYHLAHPVDDHFMEISHVTRGVEWLSTAPLHVNLFRAFGWELPVYVHLPVILNPSGKGKLSKRTQAFNDQGQQVLVRVEEFRDAGYLPQAVVNFLANVGWSFGDDREKFTIEEAIAHFDLADINPSETRLPYEKLDWLNGQYIQEMEPLALANALRPFLEAADYEVNVEALLAVTPTLGVRLKRLTDAVPLLRFLFEEEPLALAAADLTDQKLDLAAAQRAFEQARAFVQSVEPFVVDTLRDGLTTIGEQNTANGKAGPFLGKMRLAITGQQVSPPLFESMVALGRGRVLARLEETLQILSQGEGVTVREG
ncbi:MAG: glutamate--tRNA ligase [Chloroflexi bacterium]|nr:glutamate--tRNA ligase [Chloroflexota bacterium]MCI0576619.1 glutamate--tRNA ligase [Chloroflexota bacterium]MCI0647013.1 glutamate--tRNA ligase [Chloroflexota bacterium]MCI0730713.1 glutamate--tRNA ligase [Chloroflexota bacterium]